MPKKEEPPQGAPDWVVTYGDCMSLLLCFFIVLFSMSEVKKDDRFMQVMESIQAAFGGYEGSTGTMPLDSKSINSIISKLLELEMQTSDLEKGDADEAGIEGRKYRVTNIRDGVHVVIGGTITFEPFSAVLLPQARDLIAKTGDTLRGYRTKIRIRGHATLDPMPPDSLYSDARDLSYSRARAVALELELQGIETDRLILEAAGSYEPLVRQAYTDKQRAANRRVEIVVTEKLVEEYSGSALAPNQKEFLDG